MQRPFIRPPFAPFPCLALPCLALPCLALPSFLPLSLSLSYSQTHVSAPEARHHREDGRRPPFYRQFSEVLEETIRDYREKRISERDYLNNVVDLVSRMTRKDHSRRVPESIKDDMDAQAVFGVVEPVLKTFANGDASDDDAAAESPGRSLASSRCATGAVTPTRAAGCVAIRHSGTAGAQACGVSLDCVE